MDHPYLSDTEPDLLASFYAHSLAGRPVSEWQTLFDHSQAVAGSASCFAGKFGSGSWALACGWLHDIGKADKRFQRYLLLCNGLDDSEYDNTANGRVNHSSAGAALALERYGNGFGRILAYIIAGHHAGLPDYHQISPRGAPLSIRLQEGRANLKQIPDAAAAVSESLKDLAPPFPLRPEIIHLWIRMVFSCLVDADYLDTESFMQPAQAGVRGGYSGIGALKQSFDSHMATLKTTAEPTALNAIRDTILRECREAGGTSDRIRSLTVPTGGGKTLSAVAYALEHCDKFNRDRIIYVIPYTSIIEQTADVLRRIFGSDNVVEHHSNISPDKETQRSRLASENWDAPIIVTTNVQFFESLYAAKPGRCRKLHNIANSVVILDEAQLVPVKLLSPCISSLAALTENYNTTVLLSTATQPAFQNVPTGCASLPAVKEIIPDPGKLYEELKRVKYQIPSSLTEPETWEAVAERLKDHDNVLCIVNSRRDCYDLFKLMPKGTIHLSALMCGEHRSEKITEIKRRLKEGIPTRVISTQLVEAGVDIDFPVVYRAIAGLDSIAQAAGRCNREGNLESGEVVVFVPPKPPHAGLLLKADQVARRMFLQNADLNQPQTFSDFFQNFYNDANDLGNEFRTLLEKDAAIGEFSFRTAAEKFKIIDESQRPVLVRYGESEKWIRKLEHAGPTREIMRRLQRYTVNLHTRSVDTMLGDGRLMLANPELAPDVVVQNAMNYDEVLGLDVFAENLPAELLITS